MTRRLVVGTRGSGLAMIQTEYVVGRLREAAPDWDVGIRVITTHGDRDRQTKLDRMPGIGIFVKELEEALLDRRVDLAVHSLKDLPTLIPDGLALLSVTERQNPADVLAGSAKLDALPNGARVGTGSLRRGIQLKRHRPDLEVCSIRGNVDTRLRKATEGEVDAVVLAAAAMIRMGWEERITQYLPTDDFVPAIGQGAIGIEGRTDEPAVAELVSRLTDPVTWQCVTAERTFLSELGGGCRSPIAGLATVSEGSLRLTGLVADPEGTEVLRAETAGDADRPERVGTALAATMMDMGADRLISEVTPQ
jgi:hydroxymethylbilane synthase